MPALVVARLLTTDRLDAVRSPELLTAKSGTSQRRLCITTIDACIAQLELKYEIQHAVAIDVSQLELSELCTFGARTSRLKYPLARRDRMRARRRFRTVCRPKSDP